MIAGLLVLQALALGLVGEAPCSDTPPSAWSVGELPVRVTPKRPCVDLMIAADGSVIVAAGDADGVGLAELDGGTWTQAFHVDGGGCPVLSRSGDALRVAFRMPTGVLVATRVGSVWLSDTVPAGDGPFVVLPDGGIRTIEVGPFGETLVVRDSGTTGDELVPLPDTPLGGNLVDLIALSLAADGGTHVLFQRNSHPALEYASNATGSWTFEVAERLLFDRPESSPGKNNAWPRVGFEVDADGHAHLAFRLRPSMKLGYATNRSGEWVTSIVDHGAPVGLGVELRLDEGGAPWLAYQRAARGDLVLATRVDGSWQNVTVDAHATVGNARALARDPQGRWQLAYTRVDWTAHPVWSPRAIQHAVSAPCTTGRLP